MKKMNSIKQKPINNKRIPLPMNIQFFAEGGEGSNGGSEEGEEGGEGGSDDLSTDAMLKRIAELETQAKKRESEYQKLKAANDKNSSNAAEYKRQLIARMSAQEQAEEAEKEAAAEREKKYKDMEKKIATMEAKDAFIGLKMDSDLASKAAEAKVSGNEEELFKLLKDHIDAIEKNAYEKFLKERGEVGAGKESGAEDKAATFAKNMGTSRRLNKVNSDSLSRWL